MKTTHSSYLPTDKWERIGTKIKVDEKSYVANCNMQSAMSFDDMRLIMYNEGKIEPYEFGKATSQEMLDVLNYAYSYYKANENNQKQKGK